MYSKLFREVIKRSLRIPTLIVDSSGDSNAITRQLDSVLMTAGFKLSEDTLHYLNILPAGIAKDNSTNILRAVKELIGDHVSHNAYFINFPKNVPDTIDFWTDCITDALSNPDSAEKISLQLKNGIVNLLDLPKYGNYQHTYEDLIAAHNQFIPSIKDRLRILHLGKNLQDELINLYHSLAESSIPLNKEDLNLLQTAAKVCLLSQQPVSIPIRENRAVINKVHIENNCELLVNTVTDILRLACILSDGDVTLSESTKFKSFPRKIRRRLIQELDTIVKESSIKLADVNRYSEQWKRLGEFLHIHEYKRWPNAQDVFAVARKDRKVTSIVGRVEIAFSEGKINKGIALLSTFPGMLFRNLDRIIRLATPSEMKILIRAISKTVSKVPTRIILSVLDHLQNRLSQDGILFTNNKRMFINKKGSVWVTDDNRILFTRTDVEEVFNIFNKELHSRTRPLGDLVVDKNILKVAIPLSNKNKSSGFVVMPRGSTMSVTNKTLRFFIYWKEKLKTTDYDLSAIMLDESFQSINHLSYTNTRTYDGVHSGDLVNAPNGASEFIDINLDKTKCKYIIPSINIFIGESFTEVEETFFGFMERTPEQKGKPFEPATVKTKADLRGNGKVALPLVFIRNDNNEWTAKWLNIYLNGMLNMNRVEENKKSTILLVKSIVEHKYLCVDYLMPLLQRNSKSFSWYQDQTIENETNTFVGINVPKELPSNTKVFSLNNLQDLLLP